MLAFQGNINSVLLGGKYRAGLPTAPFKFRGFLSSGFLSRNTYPCVYGIYLGQHLHQPWDFGARETDINIKLGHYLSKYIRAVSLLKESMEMWQVGLTMTVVTAA